MGSNCDVRDRCVNQKCEKDRCFARLHRQLCQKLITQIVRFSMSKGIVKNGKLYILTPSRIPNRMVKLFLVIN